MTEIFLNGWLSFGVLVVILIIFDTAIYGNSKSPSWISVPGGLSVIGAVLFFVAWLLSLIWS